MEKTDATLLPGIKPVLELLRSTAHRVDSVFCKKGLRSPEALEIQDLCRKNNIHYTLLDSFALDKLCQNKASNPVNHQGIVARLTSCSLCSLSKLFEEVVNAPLPLLLALDQVKDPGNLGTLARTAYALGAGGILLPEHNSAYLGPAALRSSAGALEKLPLSKATNLGIALDEAEEKGFTIYGTGRGPSSPLTVNPFTVEFSFPAVIVLGSEEKGIRPGVAKRCSQWLEIPFQRPFNSLNVAQAGGIILAMASAFSYAKKQSE